MNKTNPERQYVVQRIEQRIYELFDSMNDLIDLEGNPTRETHPYLCESEEFPNLSWIGFHESRNPIQIDQTRMRQIVRGAIEQALNKRGQVLVYYCPDNAHIAIENPDGENLAEIEDLFDQDSEINELRIAKD